MVRPGRQDSGCDRAVSKNTARAVRQGAHDAPGRDGDVCVLTGLHGAGKAHFPPRLGRRAAGHVHPGGVHVQPFPRCAVRADLLQQTLQQAVDLPVAPAKNFQQAANHALVQVQAHGQITVGGEAVLCRLHITEYGGPDVLNRPGNTRCGSRCPACGAYGCRQ